MKVNFHTHSTFCDGKNTPEEMVTAAIEKKFDILGFSSHCTHPLNPDFYSELEPLWHLPADKARIKEYVQIVNFLKEKYASQIKIFTGFEADYITSQKVGNAVPCKNAYKEFSPDFLIGSVHFVITDKGFYTVDNSTENVLKGLKELYSDKNGKIDGKRAVCEYFAMEREMLKKGNFDIIGHADLIRKRNGELKFFSEKEDWYKKEIKTLAAEIAKAGVIAEINTGAIARGAMDDTYPSLKFLEMLHEKGVPVCINSDAHTASTLDCAFDRAAENAHRAGYTELNYPCGISVKLSDFLI